MGVLVGFVVGYVMGTKAGEKGLEQLTSTLRALTTSGDLKELVSGAAGIVGDAVKSGTKTLAA